MSKKVYIEILGDDYYNEINNYCQKKVGKNIQDIEWRDGTSWMMEISFFLKENFNIGVHRKVNGPLGGWCHGAGISESNFEVINLLEDEIISEETLVGIRLKRNPKRVIKEVFTDDEYDFYRWLRATKEAMDYVVETRGIQKTLLV